MSAPRKIHTLDRDVSPDEIGPRRPIQVVCDNLRSAFNVGSFFRTCDACRVERLHLCGITAYPPNAKLSKTALGTLDYVPWRRADETLACVLELKASGLTVWAVERTACSRSLFELEVPDALALVFGHEVDGVDDAVLAACDAVVELPMEGLKNSLNVATSVGVVLYEVVRQHEQRAARLRAGPGE